jgi:hypothetical protein
MWENDGRIGLQNYASRTLTAAEHCECSRTKFHGSFADLLQKKKAER